MPLPAASGAGEIATTGEAADWKFGSSIREGSRHWIRFDSIGSFLVRTDTLETAGYPLEGVGRERLVESFWHSVAPVIMEHMGWGCIHASAVLTPAGIVAFCGPSGRGKSTLARAWAERGAIQYSDDCVPFFAMGEKIYSARLPQRPRLRGEAAAHFAVPDDRRENRRSGGTAEELVLDLGETLRPLHCVYWLEPGDRNDGGECVRIEPIAPQEAFTLLLSEAHCMSLDDRVCNRKMVVNYLALVRRTPVLRLRFARRFDRIPEVLACLERHSMGLATG